MLRSLKRKEMKRKIKFERRRKNRIKRKINFSSKRNRFIYNYVKYTRMNIKKYL